MGKNKNGKKGMNPLFRVAGGKAAKAKAKLKAQPVSTNLRKLNAEMVKSKVQELDKCFVEVHSTLNTTGKPKEKVTHKPNLPLPPADINQAISDIASL